MLMPSSWLGLKAVNAAAPIVMFVVPDVCRKCPSRRP